MNQFCKNFLKLSWAVILLAPAVVFAKDEALTNAGAGLKIHAVVKSNRTNIYEGDIVDLDLRKGKSVDTLIGSGEDYSGYVVAEVEKCRDEKFYQLFKRKIVKGKPISENLVVDKVTCQKGLASLIYEMKFEDLCKEGESVEFSLAEEGSGKPVYVLGAVVPKIQITHWESYLFINENFQYMPLEKVQPFKNVDNVYVVLSTAFSKFLNGQNAKVEYSIEKNGSLQRYVQEFVLEYGEHSLDLSRHKDNLEIGDVITANYTIGDFKYTNVFKVSRDYSQQVFFEKGIVHYNLEVNDVDWYISDSLICFFDGCDYARGGKSIEISHPLGNPLGGVHYGNYEIHMTLNGYTHLFVNTSLLK